MRHREKKLNHRNEKPSIAFPFRRCVVKYQSNAFLYSILAEVSAAAAATGGPGSLRAALASGQALTQAESPWLACQKGVRQSPYVKSRKIGKRSQKEAHWVGCCEKRLETESKSSGSF